MSEIPGSNPNASRIIHLDQVEQFERPGFDGHHLVKKEDGLPYSMILVNVHGSHPLKQMTGATRSYFVIDGEGEFEINGRKSKAREGTLFVLPDGTQYSYHGEMTLLEFNVPGTTSANAVTLDPKK